MRFALSTTTTVGADARDSGPALDTPDAARVAARRFIEEVINAQNLGPALEGLVAEDFVEHNPLPRQGPGRSGLADVPAGMFATFPDLRWTVHDTVVEKRPRHDVLPT